MSAISADFDPDTGRRTGGRRARRANRTPPHPLPHRSLRLWRALARQRAAILANMEMWRWEPRDMGERRIEVNIADFSVAALEGDRVILKSRVIVGKPETPTPIFSSVMRYVLINPSWQVPDSIIRKELASKARLAEPARLRGEDRRRATDGPPVARRRQRARPDRVHVSERPCDLSARYAGAGAVRRGNPRLQPRLRSRRGPAESGRRSSWAARRADGRTSGSRPRSGTRNGPCFCPVRCPFTSSTSLILLTNSASCRSGRTSTG